MDRKKIIIISASAIIGLIIVGLLVYLLAFNQPPTSQKQEQAPIPFSQNSPETKPQESTLRELLPNAVSVIWSETEQKFLAISTNGFLYSIDPDNFNVSTSTNFGISNILDATWSKDKTRAIFSYKENNLFKKIAFDTTNQRIIPLASQITNPVFSPEKSDQILYIFNQNKNGILQSFLSLANFDGAKFKNISSFLMPDAVLSWPPALNGQIAQTAYAISPASGSFSASAYSINLRSGSLQKFLSEQNGQQIKFSPSGTKLLYSFVDDRGKNLRLFYRDLKTNLDVLLPIKTLAEKCSFDKNELNLYCAAPNKIAYSATMPDDYYANSLNSKDDLWIYNTKSNSAYLAVSYKNIPDATMQMIEVFPDESNILFIQKENLRLFSLKLR